MPAAPAPARDSDDLLRASILFLVAAQAGFIVYMTWHLWRAADPMGDGMELVAVGAAVMLIFMPMTLPALVLALNRRLLGLAGSLAVLATLAYGAFWSQVLDELGR